MRILFLSHQFFPRHVGGTEVYLRGIERRLRAAGHETLVVSCHESDEAGPVIMESEADGERTVELHLNLGRMADPARAEHDNPLAGEAIARVVRAFAPDVVHAMHCMKMSGAALEACHRAGVPVVAALTDYWYVCPRTTLVDSEGRECDGPTHAGKCVPCVQELHGFPVPPERGAGLHLVQAAAVAQRPLRLRRLLLGCARIVALSDEQKRAFVANGYPSGRIEVIPHGLELSDLSGASPRAAGPLKVLGIAGSIVEHKGPHVVLEALRLVPDLDLECRVHGPLRDDAYCARIRLLARRDARVRLMGGFAPHETGRVLSGLDLLAVPALWRENEPLLVKAALHLGIPVLATPLGSVGEMVRRAGGTTTRGDAPEDWADALRELAPAVPQARPHPQKSMDDNAAEWLAIYREEARRCVRRSA